MSEKIKMTIMIRDPFLRRPSGTSQFTLIGEFLGGGARLQTFSAETKERDLWLPTFVTKRGRKTRKEVETLVRRKRRV